LKFYFKANDSRNTPPGAKAIISNNFSRKSWAKILALLTM
jgi:hypothetical protein